jgi:hypothetical protein
MSRTFSAIAQAWGSWRPATCLPDDCFCEGLREGLVRQPANTWSSLAFVLAALWMAVRIRREGGMRTTLSAPNAWLFVASVSMVGLGSAFYHASLTFMGQVLDVSGMYLVATFILFHRLGPRWGISPLGTVVGFALVNAALMAAQVTTPSLRRVVFGVLLVGALALEWRSSGEGRKWLETGAGLMALAFLIWIVDRERLLCAPDSPLQGHAVWHLLSAAAALCLFRSYERPQGTLAA